MDSIGYVRFLILAFFFISQCLHGTQTQSLMDSDDDTLPTEAKWEPEGFNEEADQTYNLVFHKYNNRIRPPDFVIKVDLAVTLTHVRHLDVSRQELQTVLDLELNWRDSRLQWRPYLVKEIHESTESVWCPDIVYTNGVSPVEQLYPKVVKIVHNGSVTWLRKEIVTTRCETSPSSPEQLCPIKIGFVLNRVGDDEQNKFFFAEGSSVSISSGADVFSHNWRLDSMEMKMGEENETTSTTIDLELGFQRQSLGDSNDGGRTDANPGSGYRGSTVDTTYNPKGDDRTSSARQEGVNGSGCGSECCCKDNGGSSYVHIRNFPLMTSSLVVGLFLVGVLMDALPFTDSR